MCLAPAAPRRSNRATCRSCARAAASSTRAGLSPPCHAALPSAEPLSAAAYRRCSPTGVVGLRPVVHFSLPLYRTTPPYKARPKPLSLPFPTSIKPSRQAIRRNSSPPRPAPPQFQHPKASSPLQLAPQSTLAELCSLLSRNQGNTVPPLPPVKPEPPHRRRPPSTPPPAEPGTGIASPRLHDAHARSIPPCSLAPHQEHRRAITAAAIPRRRPCSAASLCAHHPPACAPRPVGRIGPVSPQPNPRRRREHAGQAPRPLP
jgi:hypothetical protein